jgi:hypothetical protein
MKSRCVMPQNIAPLPQARSADYSVVRFVIMNGVTGMALGVVLALSLLLFNFAGLRDILAATGLYVPTYLLLTMGFAVTFGGAFCASAIMLLPEGDEPPQSGIKEPDLCHIPEASPSLVRVKVRTRM